jgi:DinB superfamily
MHKEESMAEDVQTYKKRLLGYLGDQDPINILSWTPERLRQLLQQSRSEDKPSSDRWSRLQLLAHFTEGEMIFAVRLRIIATDSGANIQAYDQEKFMQRAGYLFDYPEKTLELFSGIRSANLSYLKNLPEEAWDNYGIHSERGRETIGDLVSLYAAHDLNHLKQFESAN